MQMLVWESTVYWICICTDMWLRLAIGMNFLTMTCYVLLYRWRSLVSVLSVSQWCDSICFSQYTSAHLHNRMCFMPIVGKYVVLVLCFIFQVYAFGMMYRNGIVWVPCDATTHWLCPRYDDDDNDVLMPMTSQTLWRVQLAWFWICPEWICCSVSGLWNLRSWSVIWADTGLVLCVDSDWYSWACVSMMLRDKTHMQYIHEVADSKECLLTDKCERRRGILPT